MYAVVAYVLAGTVAIIQAPVPVSLDQCLRDQLPPLVRTARVLQAEIHAAGCLTPEALARMRRGG